MAVPPDWSLGSYERTAVQLLPAAQEVVDEADLAAGERVVDVGCGTGNAALLAAARGARVVGVDPAARLLEVARNDAAAQRLDADFMAGDAAALPLDDASMDVALSVFGVIYAPDAQAVATELARVTTAEGRIVLSAWTPAGALADMNRLLRETVARVTGAPPGPPPFPWHERAAVADLLGPHGFAVQATEHPLAFTGASPATFFDAEAEHHPLAVGGRAALEQAGELDALRERAIAVLDAGNEDPGAFRVTSHYVVVAARRG
jgi:SAM-dependent methyltransferase